MNLLEHGDMVTVVDENGRFLCRGKIYGRSHGSRYGDAAHYTVIPDGKKSFEDAVTAPAHRVKK